MSEPRPDNRRTRWMDAIPDVELLERSGRGEADAFAALVRRYAPMVHAIALSSTGRAASKTASDAGWSTCAYR